MDRNVKIKEQRTMSKVSDLQCIKSIFLCLVVVLECYVHVSLSLLISISFY